MTELDPVLVPPMHPDWHQFGATYSQEKYLTSLEKTHLHRLPVSFLGVKFYELVCPLKDWILVVLTSCRNLDVCQ